MASVLAKKAWLATGLGLGALAISSMIQLTSRAEAASDSVGTLRMVALAFWLGWLFMWWRYSPDNEHEMAVVAAAVSLAAAVLAVLLGASPAMLLDVPLLLFVGAGGCYVHARRQLGSRPPTT